MPVHQSACCEMARAISQRVGNLILVLERLFIRIWVTKCALLAGRWFRLGAKMWHFYELHLHEKSAYRHSGFPRLERTAGAIQVEHVW